MISQNTVNQLKHYLRKVVEETTARSKGANMYVCPFCGSGTGKSKTGALSLDAKTHYTTWHCFACDRGGDVFDYVGEMYKLDEFSQRVKKAAEIVGVRVEDDARPMEGQDDQNNQRGKEYGKPMDEKPKAAQEKADYTEFFREAALHIDDLKDDQRRGLSLDTCRRFNVGYVAGWKHPKAPDYAQLSPRLIIPTSGDSYLARDLRRAIPENQKIYEKQKVGPLHIFNAEALTKADKPIYIVEGEIDALSVIDAGGEAVGLGTTTKAKALVTLISQNRPQQPLIIALDNDGAGAKAAAYLAAAFKGMGIFFLQADPAQLWNGMKDANELLTSDKNALRLSIATTAAEAQAAQVEQEAAAREEYLNKTSAARTMQDFINGIKASADTPCISTGFPALDVELDGGLYEGLYIVGAVTSLGKTTFVMQIADQIARDGHDVLIFSLEMSKHELIGKSISRHTSEIVDSDDSLPKRWRKTARGITAGHRYKGYSQGEKELIMRATMVYNQYAGHVYIVEGMGNIGAAQVRGAVAQHISFTGKIPVVFVDYLQILATHDERATDKQKTDVAVVEMKRISRDYKTPVICVSSFNRDNYANSATMSAFKESGAIEYSSDVLIALQFKGVGGKNFQEVGARKKDPREIQLVILKNRYGPSGNTLNYRYWKLFNRFEETEEQGTAEDTGPEAGSETETAPETEGLSRAQIVVQNSRRKRKR